MVLGFYWLLFALLRGWKVVSMDEPSNPARLAALSKIDWTVTVFTRLLLPP
jgi:hypothetical protein